MSHPCVNCRWYAPNFDPPRKWWQLDPGAICRNPHVEENNVTGGPDYCASQCKIQRSLYYCWRNRCGSQGKWFEPHSPYKLPQP